MDYRYTLFLSSLLFILISCSNVKEYEGFFDAQHQGDAVISIETLNLDTILLKDIESSYTGYVDIYNDTLCFIDARFGWIFLFDNEGKLRNRKLGQGRGPMELNTSYIDAYCFLDDGRKIFIGSSLDVHLYNREGYRSEQSRIEWRGKYDYSNIANVSNPLPDEISVYTLSYEQLIIREHDNYIYANIHSEHDNFNMYRKTFYEEGRILAKIDMDNWKVIDILGRRSPEYLKYEYVGHLSYVSFDISSQGDFYVNYEIDPSIYVYDSDFNLKYSFGIPGKNMNLEYKELDKITPSSYREMYYNEKPRSGYYNDVKYFSEGDILFRTYNKGGNSLEDGLQIYKANNLIGDVAIPKGCKVRGYIAPYYYMEGKIDEDNETIPVYRFRI